MRKKPEHRNFHTLKTTDPAKLRDLQVQGGRRGGRTILERVGADRLGAQARTGHLRNWFLIADPEGKFTDAEREASARLYWHLHAVKMANGRRKAIAARREAAAATARAQEPS